MSVLGRGSLLVLWSLLTSTGACASAASSAAARPAERSFIGTVPGTDAVVALVATDTSATFYVCGGPSTFGSLTRWFSGTADANSLHLTSPDTATVEGTIDATTAQGTLNLPDGSTRPWTARPKSVGTDEGLYATVDQGCRTGVVVTQPTAEATPSVQGTWCNLSNDHVQVTPVMPFVRQGSALEVLVAARALFVSPVVLSSP